MLVQSLPSAAKCLHCADPNCTGRGVSGNGGYIRYLTVPRVLQRYLTANQRRGRFVPEGEGST